MTIDPELAEHAERFECFCGRMLEVGPALVCSGCQRPPSRCRCDELPDDEVSEG